MKEIGTLIVILVTILFIIINWYAPILAMVLFALTLLCVSLALSKIIHRSILSPLSLFSLGWLLPAILNYIYGFYDNIWKTRTMLIWFIIIGTWVSFFIGYIITFFSLFSFGKKISRMGQNFRFVVWNRRRFEFILVFLFIIGSMSTILNLLRAFGTLNPVAIMPQYLAGFRLIERLFVGNPIMNNFYFLNGLTFILGCIYLFVYGKTTQSVIVTSLSLLMLFFLPIKTHIIQPILIGYLCAMTLGMRMRVRHIVFVLIAFLFVIIFIDAGRIFQFYELKELLTKSLLSMPKYIIQGYTNLENELIHRNILYGEAKGGLMTFGLILDVMSYFLTGNRLITRVGSEQTTIGDINLYTVKPGHNVFTFLFVPFLDWGIFGLIIVPFMLGVLSGLFYIRFLSKRDIVGLVWYSMMNGGVLLSVFWGFKLFEIRFLWWGVVVWALQKIFEVDYKLATKILSKQSSAFNSFRRRSPLMIQRISRR